MADYRIESLQKRAEARRLHEAGASIAEICRLIGRNYSTVVEYVRGTDQPKARGHRYEGRKGEDTKRLVLEARERGASILDAAKLSGVHSSTVRRWERLFCLGPDTEAA